MLGEFSGIEQQIQHDIEEPSAVARDRFRNVLVDLVLRRDGGAVV